ncbi:hypothetical protein [Actinoallomurus sp. CA-142502]|uniref:hypothetical protein n=1 Tax=Actinoallomurus sp. CA-142502 TaxID=3239885 RepID=UPI003D91C1DF
MDRVERVIGVRGWTRGQERAPAYPFHKLFDKGVLGVTAVRRLTRRGDRAGMRGDGG